MVAPMTKIGNRESFLLAQARVLEGYRYEVGKEQMAGMPVITPQQLAVLRGKYDLQGHSTGRGQVGAKRTDGFCGVLRRHRRYQLRMEAKRLRRQARALEKVAMSYFFQPSENT